MSEVVIYGADYSVYTRIVCLALVEKEVPYRLETIDVLGGNIPDDYKTRHPFLKIPTLEHNGFSIYETGAITRYIDEVFEGRSLMPEDMQAWTRANQIISILDNYAYRTLVWDVFVERVRKPEPNEGIIADALVRAETLLSAVEELMVGDSYFVGGFPTLADLYAGPMIALFRQSPEGNEMLIKHMRWLHWWNRMNDRPGMISTRAPIEG